MYRKFFHVISTGTSLLSNFERKHRFNKRIDALMNKYNLWGWHTLSPNDPMQRRLESIISSGHEVHNELYEFLSRDPLKASAELNSFLSFIDINKQNKDDIEIMMYTTNTVNNRLAATIIYEYLKNNGYHFVGEPVIVSGFGEGIEHFEDGLKNVLDKVVRIIYRKTLRGYQVYVNATAGFKPETTFVVIASLLSRRRPPLIYYMHESFKAPVKLPGIGLELDNKYIDVIKNFLEPVPINKAIRILDDYGRETFELYKLIENGLLEEKNGLIKIREWLRILIDIYYP